MSVILLVAAALALVPAQAALGQGAGTGVDDPVAGAIEAAAARLGEINDSAERLFWMSLLVGAMTTAGAVAGSVLYAKRHLDHIRADSERRLRPILSWAAHGDGSAYTAEQNPDGSWILGIRVENVGGAAATDIVAWQKSGAPDDKKWLDDSPGTPHLMGSLSPNASTTLNIPVPKATHYTSFRLDGAYRIEIQLAYYAMNSNVPITYNFTGKYLDGTLSISGTVGARRSPSRPVFA